MITRRSVVLATAFAAAAPAAAQTIEPVCARFRLTTVTPIEAQSGAGAVLPATLIIAPGVYSFGGRSFDCRMGGMYRFMAPLQETQQRIVWDGDPLTFYSAISWLTQHGRADEELTPEQLEQRALTSKVALRCGYAVPFAQRLLTQAGLENRMVRSMTLGQWTNIDDGHIMLESRIGSSWRIVDVNVGYVFDHPRGPLNGATLPAALADNSMALQQLDADGPMVERSRPGEFDAGLYAEMMRNDPARAWQWYARIAQVCGVVAADGLTYWPIPSARADVRAIFLGIWGYRVMEPADWRAQFYGRQV